MPRVYIDGHPRYIDLLTCYIAADLAYIDLVPVYIARLSVYIDAVFVYIGETRVYIDARRNYRCRKVNPACTSRGAPSASTGVRPVTTVSSSRFSAETKTSSPWLSARRSERSATK
jgi:hypothetical protein